VEVLPTPPLPPTNTNCGPRTPAANSSPYLKRTREREREKERERRSEREEAREKKRASEEVLAAAAVQLKSS
jgi:hypothetical protein